MHDPTVDNVYKAMFPPPRRPGRLWRDSVSKEDLCRRIDALSFVVRDLLVEVEALRAAAIDSPGYKTAYRDTCYLAHNNCGPSSGWHKILFQYYPLTHGQSARAWREVSMLKRLGYNKEEVDEFQSKAEKMEFFT